MGLLPGIVGFLFLHLPLTQSLEYKGLDLLFLMRGVRKPPSRVCVVAIDSASYEPLGVPGSARTWPRRLHARLIRALRREGASVVAFDVDFESSTDYGGDHALAEAISDAGNVVLGSRTEQTNDPRFNESRVIDPYEPLARHAAAVAEVAAFRQEKDDSIRTSWLVLEQRPSLALAAYEVATHDTSRRELADRLIDYYGPARTVRTVSFYQAVEPEKYLAPGFFRDRLVFVGLAQPAAAGESHKDMFSTPFSGGEHPLTYGVEIHATVAANLLENTRIDRLNPVAEGGLALIVPLFATFVFMYLRPVAGAAVFFLLELVPWAAGDLAFTLGHTWMPVMVPSVVQLPGAYVLSLIWYYMTTARERERIRRAFSFYLSPDMIARILADPASLNLGGEEITGTALFTDIQGFSSLAETMRAHEMAALLNRYFSEVNRQIFAEGGTLIKFIGDAVFAIWGAPVRTEEHATQACAAALALARAEAARIGDGDSALNKLVTRIGVNTGYMMVGNLGSEQRFDYTAIGDAVNVASRLEGLNKYLKTRVIASGKTIFLTHDSFVVRRLGLARVAGREEPVEIFEILGRQGETTVPHATALARFEAAVGDYTAGRLGQAAEGFREVLAACGGEDGPSEYYLQTIERFRRSPPEGAWDGALPFEGK